MRYAVTRLNKKREDDVYRIYVTDTLKAIAQNTAVNGGAYPTKRFAELLNPVKEKSAEEIIKEVIKSGELEVVD